MDGISFRISQIFPLMTAVERGYFQVPRETPLVDIADEHDISDAEALERIHTGIDVALREHLDGFDATVVTEEEY
jgi:hypothetical protein